MSQKSDNPEQNYYPTQFLLAHSQRMRGTRAIEWVDEQLVISLLADDWIMALEDKPHLNTLRYTHFYPRLALEDGMLRIHLPTVEEWQRFWTTIEDLGIWNWQTEYRHEPDVGDGLYILDYTPEWHISLEYGQKKLHSEGSIIYPPHFKELALAALKLSGGYNIIGNPMLGQQRLK